MKWLQSVESMNSQQWTRQPGCPLYGGGGSMMVTRGDFRFGPLIRLHLCYCIV